MTTGIKLAALILSRNARCCMLAYRHLFHAGNFADVFKHALLTRLLILLARKDKPFCYVDTHAESGSTTCRIPGRAS